MNMTVRTKIQTGWLRPVMGICAAAVFCWFQPRPLCVHKDRAKTISFSALTGHPVSGATVRVCQPGATGTPCTPLATIYTDATLTVTSANPFQTDGLGNYHFYASAGRYQIQMSSPQITGTITQPDVILPADLSSSGSGNNISAFGLTLGGNLSVAGNTHDQRHSHRHKLQSGRAIAFITECDGKLQCRWSSPLYRRYLAAVWRHRRRRRGTSNGRDRLRLSTLTVASVTGIESRNGHPRKRRGSVWRCAPGDDHEHFWQHRHARSERWHDR